ncbi:MAG TPA: DUF2441 domain-containing protein [Gammaproteobacteria bacterium]|nr:DUF2441 domain-containing protein [Gammaproteobacteria bacterium]
MHIENHKYYHIHKHNSPTWVEGAKFSFGQQPNNAWRTFEVARRGITNPENNEVYTVDLVAFRALAAYRKTGNRDPRLSFYHYDPVKTLAETLDSLFLATRMVKELVFEEIRQQMFSNLPSRTGCVWLIPESDKAVRFWLDNMRGDTKKVFRVNATGELHRAAQQPVMGDTISLGEWRKRAQDYWNGADTESYDDELILGGDIEILEEMPLSNF